MKFLTKINHNYLIPFSLVLIVITITGYFVLQSIIKYGAKEKLLADKHLIEQQIKNTGEVPNLHPVIEVVKYVKEPDVNTSFKEITIRNEIENEDELFLEYTSKIKIKDSWYLIKIRQSSFENEDLLLILALTLFILVLSAFTISFFSTRRLNKSVWAGFEHNLREIENFSFKLNKDISLESSNIEEFGRLNSVIMNVTSRLRSDYSTLKEFTENASHEIQTPLFIALVNLEEILQSDIREDVFRKVITVINSLKRLTSLNESLILLARIENKQFEAVNEVSLNEIITRKVKEFSTLLEMKNLTIKIDIEGNFLVLMNVNLSEVLINNLLSNSINHNINGGKINILIRPGFLRICNTGEDRGISTLKVFDRFVSSNPKSLGLGLAIVWQICQTHDLDINYSKEELHCFTIKTAK